MKRMNICLAVLLTAAAQESFAQQPHFIDGYHGGVYGHYPAGYTRFITGQLQANPYWKINLEIEPETWDMVKVREPQAYGVFQQLFADQSGNGRIEYVNPGYGQSYLYTGSGESMIRQFSYGMQKVREHFPGAVFTTYSSEEPCFTSALPQVLRSFGFKYASLKNPNTCWGGYTRAFGGELVQWEGPDGSRLLTVPRYSSEALLPNSTWQTTAWNNSKEYLASARAAGIANPIGMCLQDAGWHNGPWLKRNAQYETWRNYIGNVANKTNVPSWRVSQEDIQVSLVWGAQVLQRIAQQVRAAENKLIAAEKYAAITALYDHVPWPQQKLDTAWKSLLLAQHHDCWIVPYNDTWIDKVQHWTDNTIAVSDSILQKNNSATYIRVLNTTALPREEWIDLQGNWKVIDSKGRQVPTVPGAVKVSVPPMGFSVYRLQPVTGGENYITPETLETDLYRITIDPARGGVISSLIVKATGKEMVDTKNNRGFNELRGYFYQEGAWRSSMDTAARIRITENSKARVSVEINGFIAGHPFTQQVTLTNGQRRIDLKVKINWKGNPGIGAYSQADNYSTEAYRKAFYNDSCKLQVLFPLSLSPQKLSKDAPFDVTDSRLENTFFSSWDSIKNNVILHWADVTDGNTGLALFTDHTTSYVHGKDYPLGLTLQYAGRALWGRNYDITGPTEVNYAIVPHNGNWESGSISNEETRWCEPLQVLSATGGKDFSLLALQDNHWQVSTLLMDGKDLLIRLYNAGGNSGQQQLSFNGKATQAVIEQLDGQAVETLQRRLVAGKTIIRLAIPRFGIRTIRLKNVIVNN
ncbi:alpha-mannosidase [Chitinophaga ginsengisegetis]|uniref:Alpha-mannosidase n=1 Tax=Chitinophaga ginsengisegetis TaxID=393003 RepID=A0A1T5PBF5_9BACT|nr:glycoside hydrolase family 38 C-terminal domain-containing protein [Chitinophaga ginsengisegetis]SKD09982.1 alpha-mannosidase [Chitinophaga ginsengisegetis]